MGWIKESRVKISYSPFFREIIICRYEMTSCLVTDRHYVEERKWVKKEIGGGVTPAPRGGSPTKRTKSIVTNGIKELSESVVGEIPLTKRRNVGRLVS